MFEFDKQTIDDLKIFTKDPSETSVFDFFNNTKTTGGKLKLDFLMRTPSCELEDILKRQKIIHHFIRKKDDFKVKFSQLNYIEHYLNLNTVTLKSNKFDNFFFKTFTKFSRNDLFLIETGVEKILELVVLFSDNLETFLPIELDSEKENFKEITKVHEINEFLKERSFKSVSHYKFDYLFRGKIKNKIKIFIDTVYLIDAYISIANSTLNNDLVFPDFTESIQPIFILEGLRHPLIKKSISNDFNFKNDENICFLTGPNMAGKSTFLKSLGIAIYLAHLGFPAPVGKMKLSKFNGIYTTINLNDNTSFGYSHFYAEVKRLKDVILRIKERKKLFIIFDELFRGTNLVDAIEASSKVVSGFSTIKESVFFVSTHIIEIKSNLNYLENIVYKCFDVKRVGNNLKYDYSIKDGVSETRVGLHILENEDVFKILNSFKHSSEK